MVSFRSRICSFLSILGLCTINRTPTNQFATEFYLGCAKQKSGNIIISPYSVSNALTLLSHAAGGITFDQLQHGLHIGNNKSETAIQFFEHHNALKQNAGKVKFLIANAVFIQQGHQLRKSFEEVAVSKFKSEIQTLNFLGDIKNSTKIINHFVEEKTYGKIKELFKPDQLSRDTVSVIVNAIYLKGDWERPFDSRSTAKRNFYNNGTEEVSVDMMYTKDWFNVAYIDELDATALEMKYVFSNISFVIVLPESYSGLAALETDLNYFNLTQLSEKFKAQQYHIYVPKFKIEYDLNLQKVLENMGMTDMFTNNANLTELLETVKPLKVSKAVHKAFIEVTERGTEAAAATGISETPYSIDYSNPPTLIVDHPFIFFIRDIQTNTVIFSGRIEKLEGQKS